MPGFEIAHLYEQEILKVVTSTFSHHCSLLEIYFSLDELRSENLIGSQKFLEGFFKKINQGLLLKVPRRNGTLKISFDDKMLECRGGLVLLKESEKSVEQYFSSLKGLFSKHSHYDFNYMILNKGEELLFEFNCRLPANIRVNQEGLT